MNLPCFVCPIQFDDVSQLCKHIQNVHKIRGSNSYQCKLCNKVLGELDTFKRHLERCMKKTRNVQQKNHQNNETGEVDKPKSGVNLGLFEKITHDAALQFVLKLSSKMGIPRNFVFEILEDIQVDIVSMIAHGIENVFTPMLANNDDKAVLRAFVQICQSIFCNVETEHKLNTKLEKADLISALSKFPIGTFITQRTVFEQSDVGEDSDQSFDQATLEVSQESQTEVDMEAEQIIEDEDISEYDLDSRFNTPENGVKVATGTLMPIKFQLRKFFEMKGVFKTVMDHADEISKGNDLNHFIKGSLWKWKRSSYTADQIVIPYHLYTDETQINNALGTHCSLGLENCVYYSFPTIPPQFQPRLDNIFVAMVSSAADTKNFGPDACFEPLVRILNDLAENGIKIEVDGVEHTVFFVLGLFLGDNAALNSILGFNPCSSNVFCKHCQLTKENTRKSTIEISSMLRNEENYEEDLLKDDEKETGVKWNSIFNTIFLFHVVHSAGVDIMHDIHEGILRYNMCAIILSLIKRKIFSLKTLNDRKRNFVYNHPDCGNKSGDLILKKLKKNGITMSASEMMTFFLSFPFLVGDLIAPNDEAWMFYLKTLEVVDLVYLTSFTEANLLKLKDSIAEMNSMYLNVFKRTLKPKHHFLTHYPTLIRSFGPLRYISSLRYEAKHRIIKKYTKNTESRKNISYSIGLKLRYDFAKIITTTDSLQDKLTYKHPRTITLSSQKYFKDIESSNNLSEMAQSKIYEVDSMEMNGILFSAELFIPKENASGGITVWKICNIFVSPGNEAYLLCRKYSKAVWLPHYGCYEASEFDSDKTMVLEGIKNLLKIHILPVFIHSFSSKKIFRLRYY